MQRTLFTVLCLSAFAMNATATISETVTHPPKATLANADGVMLRLGDGYFTYDHMSAGQTALSGRDKLKTLYADLQNTINLSQTIDRDELSRDLNVDISASGGWGMFSASASANYMHHTENTEYTENFTYSERYYANAMLDISPLSPDTKGLMPAAAKDYKAHGVKAFTNRYGDTFIRQLPEGAFLVVNLQLHFTSALDKTNFDAAIGGGFGSIFSASASIQSAVMKSNSHGEVEVSAYQLGGDATKLANIFAKKAGGGYYITTCSLDNLKDCNGTIDGIIDYAQNNFSQQIKPNLDTGKPVGNLVVVGQPLLTTYSSNFNIDPAPPLDPTVVAARLQLTDMYNSMKKKKTFFDHFVASPAAGHFTPDGDKLIRSIQSALTYNASLYDQFGAIHCWMPGEESECAGIIDSIKQINKSIDQQAIDYYMDTGFHEIGADCRYYPVGIPSSQTPMYANFCFGKWIQGTFIISVAKDKNKLSIKGDYINYSTGHHIQSDGALPRNGTDNYSGLLFFKDLNTGIDSQRSVSVTKTINTI